MRQNIRFHNVVCREQQLIKQSSRPENIVFGMTSQQKASTEATAVCDTQNVNTSLLTFQTGTENDGGIVGLKE